MPHGTRLMAHGLTAAQFLHADGAGLFHPAQRPKYHVTSFPPPGRNRLQGATAYCGRNRPKLAIVIDCTLDTVQLDDCRPVKKTSDEPPGRGWPRHFHS
ncbi:MAG: hypothetical protein ACLT8E_04635 [Akkermansia sp.]